MEALCWHLLICSKIVVKAAHECAVLSEAAYLTAMSADRREDDGDGDDDYDYDG